jgi:hypothetical protein
MKTETLIPKAERMIPRRSATAQTNGEKNTRCRGPGGESVRWIEHQKKVALAIVRLCTAQNPARYQR